MPVEYFKFKVNTRLRRNKYAYAIIFYNIPNEGEQTKLKWQPFSQYLICNIHLYYGDIFVTIASHIDTTDNF